ncbi:MAG: flavin reductase family protein [Candidatus Cloacimonetes bacterium]|nr:flavin reductase family protein [Candidatus Cloacimonadota bacterium]MBS3766531.1 flavin reductase family protein [Candidatus Cloacimonadota bacterium]
MKQCEYKQAVSNINRPNRIALAVSQSADEEKTNIITLGWFMRTSISPPMFAISVGVSRFSYELLSDNRKFVLAFPSQKMVEKTIQCGTQSGSDVDKIKEFNIKTQNGKLSSIPLLSNAVANFECKNVSQIRSGDHTIFIGEVKYSWINQDPDIKLLLSVEDNEKYEVLHKSKNHTFGLIK